MHKQMLCSQKRGVLYPGHGADVVLMAVSDDDSLDLGPPAVQKAGVWKNLLHSQVCEAAQNISGCHAPLSDGVKGLQDCPFFCDVQ